MFPNPQCLIHLWNSVLTSPPYLETNRERSTGKGMGNGNCASVPDSPDLMILDILIPGVDGLEVCHRMKEDPANRTAIIAISGQPEMESKILKAGADCFMAKPLDLDKLLEEAKRLLRIL